MKTDDDKTLLVEKLTKFQNSYSVTLHTLHNTTSCHCSEYRTCNVPDIRERVSPFEMSITFSISSKLKTLGKCPYSEHKMDLRYVMIVLILIFFKIFVNKHKTSLGNWGCLLVLRD